MFTCQNQIGGLLVVEVVSPGELQRERDYIAKRTQYQDCGIPEFWIIDPDAQTILVLKLTDNTYTEVASFSGQEQVRSPKSQQSSYLLVSQFSIYLNKWLTVIAMGRKPTVRTTKLIRVPIKFKPEVKAFIISLKERDKNWKTAIKK